MKCTCDECGGGGHITCPECNGEGHQEGDISKITLSRNIKNYDELIELQRDAKRVIKQAARLQELRPNRSQSYEEQLRATLFVINAQADKAAAKDAT